MKWFLKSVYCVIFVTSGWIFCNGAGCAEGWRSYASSCYYFSPDWRTWNEAFDQCKALQSYLVEIEDSEENEFLASVYATTLHRNKSCAYYIGLADLDIEGQWKWMTSETPLAIFTSHWYPGEPNNYENRDEDCVCFWREEPGTWNDITCSSPYHYICERTELTPATGMIKTTESTAATDAEDATVPIYVFAVVVASLVLLLVATILSIMRKKCCQSNINTAEIQTTMDGLYQQNDLEDTYNYASIMPTNSDCTGFSSGNDLHLQSDREEGYNFSSVMSVGSGYVGVISGNNTLERDDGYEMPILRQIIDRNAYLTTNNR